MKRNTIESFQHYFIKISGIERWSGQECYVSFIIVQADFIETERVSVKMQSLKKYLYGGQLAIEFPIVIST